MYRIYFDVRMSWLWGALAVKQKGDPRINRRGRPEKL
jgi:hypothetical protein